MVQTHTPTASSQYRPPRVLIVEDEFLIASLIEDMVTGLGYSVAGVAVTVAEALKEFSELNFDVVLLDINLDGQRNPETANFLLERGIPFAFVSGYDTVINPHHAHVPMLHKPFTDEQLGAALAELVGPGEVQDMMADGTDSTTPPTTKQPS
jgi:CheY-like chemotaxis protein